MKNTIIISDLHVPYQHPNAMAFIKAVKDVYDIQIAKCSGDIADNHSSSFHPTEYDTYSAKEEYHKAKKYIRELAEIFPKMTTVLGNHCIMSKRKAKVSDIPEEHIVSYNQMYGLEDFDWTWKDKDYFKINKDLRCLLVHAMAGNTLTNAKVHSHASIQGHHHGMFGIEYFADTEVIRWSMTVGCLINPRSAAFNYSKLNSSKRPILGLGAIIDDMPLLIPMVLNKSGKWNRKV